MDETLTIWKQRSKAYSRVCDHHPPTFPAAGVAFAVQSSSILTLKQTSATPLLNPCRANTKRAHIPLDWHPPNIKIPVLSTLTSRTTHAGFYAGTSNKKTIGTNTQTHTHAHTHTRMCGVQPHNNPSPLSGEHERSLPALSPPPPTPTPTPTGHYTSHLPWATTGPLSSHAPANVPAAAAAVAAVEEEGGEKSHHQSPVCPCLCFQKHRWRAASRPRAGSTPSRHIRGRPRQYSVSRTLGLRLAACAAASWSRAPRSRRSRGQLR